MKRKLKIGMILGILITFLGSIGLAGCNNDDDEYLHLGEVIYKISSTKYMFKRVIGCEASHPIKIDFDI